MTAQTITPADLVGKTVTELPTRPTAPRSFGGLGYSPEEMKAAFDALPLLLVERFNALLDDVSATGDDSLAAAIPTGNVVLPTLADVLNGISNGTLAAVTVLEDRSVAAWIANLDARLLRIEQVLGFTNGGE